MVFLPDTEIELLNTNLVRGQVRSVLFDFDGTLSLIREGWQGVMIPMMVETLAALNSGETEAELTAIVTEFVDRLTGKQTIYQMLELCVQIERRGGTPLDPLVYKHRYLERLWAHIAHRVEGLKSGRIPPEELIVPGGLEILENLQARGITMYLASGTDLPNVLDEAEALGIARFFSSGEEKRIFGALDDYRRFSKAQVIQDILRNHRLNGAQLLTFGDGFVEIEETKQVGGIAVGVASDEVARRRINGWKRNRLIQAGADIIIPDFRRQSILLDYLLGPA